MVIPVHADSDECLEMRKVSTQEFYCVSPDSVEKLYERGWGTPGKAWKDVCYEHTILQRPDSNCMMTSSDTTGLQPCLLPNPIPQSESCLQINDFPVTVDDCRDKYYFAYRPQIGSAYIDLLIYSERHCDLHPSAKVHGVDCLKSFLKHSDISKKYQHHLSERYFVYSYCLTGTEPDWDALGIFHIDPYPDTYSSGREWPEEHRGFIHDFFRILSPYCIESYDDGEPTHPMLTYVEQPCTFFHDSGINSTVLCPGLSDNSIIYTAQFVQDPVTSEYSCQYLLNPEIDCPGYEPHNGTHYYDIWFNDDTLRYSCTLVEHMDLDFDWIEDSVDQCPNKKEDYKRAQDGKHDGCPSAP